MREARIWYSRDPNQEMLPGSLEHEIVLVDEFFREVTTHSIPTDLGAAQSPVVLTGSLGSVYVAVLPLIHGKRSRKSAHLWRLWYRRPAS